MHKNEPTEVRSFPVELRAREGRRVTGVLCRYDKEYDLGVFRELLRPGVFRKSITESARALPLLLSHRHENVPVGKAVAWHDTDRELAAEWELDTRSEAVEVARQIEDGFLTGLSVGFSPIQSQWHDELPKPIVTRIEARLFESSLTGVPAYPDAGVVAIRSAGHPEQQGLAVRPTPRLAATRAWLATLPPPPVVR